MKHFLLFFTVLVLVASGVFAQCPTLIWSDEFNGSQLDLNKWEPMIGDGCDYGICGWGNNELQYYKSENAVVSNGTLKIIAKEERIRNKSYTSARLRSKGLADFTFGRFEARVKLLEGRGLWPAFWMLSTNEPYGGWPQSGEIDIMELLGQEPGKAFGTIHYGDLFPNNQQNSTYFYNYDGTSFANDFHVFAVEWEPGILRFYIDDILFKTLTPADLAPYNWPFDSTNQMHFLLNVAVGGNLPGNPDISTPFPSQMEVDYVRVYDGVFDPSISGKRLVPFQANGEVYTINNTDGSETFNWDVPAGASIINGNGTNSITVDWGATGGNVNCNVTSGCISKTYSIDVVVEPDFSFDFSFENFDQTGNATLLSATGTLTEVTNPDTGGINSSAVSAAYIRNSQEQYDVLQYITQAITDASLYKTRQKKFFMDVKTDAPPGTEIIIQLESADATPSNYPVGRHSRYIGRINGGAAWERITFEYLDSPDASTADSSISDIIILFASNSFTGNTYYWDNFDSYNADNGPGGTNNPPSANFNYSASDLLVSFDGSLSTDSDGTITGWNWDFGDGNTGTGSGTTHTYANAGDYNVALTVTDNEGATGSFSSLISVSDTNGTPVSLHVQSVVTGTQDAGKGSKSGTATVVIHNNLEAVVSSATVTGTFSGTFTETVSGITTADGTVVLVTSQNSKGSVTVNFCVDSVTHGSLTYDPAQNDMSCNNQLRTGETSALSGEMYNGEKVILYPNPGRSILRVTMISDKIEIFDFTGKKIKTLFNPGNQIDVSALQNGSYFVKITSHNETFTRIFIKQ